MSPTRCVVREEMSHAVGSPRPQKLPDPVTPRSHIDPKQVRAVLGAQKLDGWLCFDFHGVNPIAQRVIEFDGMVTRRVFVWYPADGKPRAIVHRIDRGAIAAFDGEIDEYTTWEELHRKLEPLVKGQRIAMEISLEDAVPYLDRVPAGVIQLLERMGATVASSATLVTRFASRWSDTERHEHGRSAEAIARIARDTLSRVVQQVGKAREYEVQQEVLDAMAEAGLQTDDPPIVAFAAHAANPHYAPRPDTSATLGENEVVLLDLWGRPSATSVWADQTWMAFAGNRPPAEVQQVWEATRDARDAVIDRLRRAHERGEPLTGAVLDDVARQLLTERGYGAAFVHRTGHSIDIELHGSGPHLDNFETRDERELLPGVGFSVEPGVYLPGRFGVRSEVNVVLADDGPEVTPEEPQRELILPA